MLPVSADRILSEARSWIGTPFTHQGRSKGLAVDCIGLIHMVAISLKLAPEELDPEYRGYKDIPDNGKLEKGLNQYMDKVRMSQIQPGDVLLMTFTGDPQHVGFFTGETIVHALSTA